MTETLSVVTTWDRGHRTWLVEGPAGCYTLVQEDPQLNTHNQPTEMSTPVNPTTTQFQVGDVVRRTIEHSSRPAPRGYEFPITRIGTGGGIYGLARDGREFSSLPDRIELVRRATEPNVDPSTLEPGDVVRLTGSRWDCSPVYPAAGTEVTILPRDRWSGGNPAFANPLRDGDKLFLYNDWTASLVRKATPAEPERRPGELRVGDRVRLTGSCWPREHQGKVVTVDKFEDTQAWSNENFDGDYNVGSVTKSDGSPYDDGYEVELVEPAAPATPELPATFSRYTPEMLPMFTALADAADRAGHCPEYDRLAAVVGAPDRAEIRRLNRPAKVIPEVDGLYITPDQLDSISPVVYKRVAARWVRVSIDTYSDSREVSAENLPDGLVKLGVVS